MTIAYWCVLIAAIIPMLMSMLAKAGGPGFDNSAVRSYLEAQTGWRQRANWAQQNGYEAFPPFAAGVIIAQQAGVDPSTINTLAVAFIVIRLLYGAVYIANLATLRSLVWAAGLACVVGLFVAAA
jgi:uncharacterized MAPEG superfamily protein